jgi:hypothetical protein
MRRRVLLLLASALLATPTLAGPYFVEVTGTYSRYDMGTVNEFLDSVNEDSGTQAFEHLDSGGTWGVNLGLVSRNRLATSVGFERLSASARSTPPPVVMHVHAPANVIRFQLAYALARLGPVIPFVQGGAGFIWNRGYLEYQDEFGNNRRYDFKGSTIAFEGLAGAEVRLTDRFGLNLSVGYRLADISSPEWDATSFGGYGTFTGPGFDYSGLMVRVGLRIGLNWQGDASETRDSSESQTGWM